MEQRYIQRWVQEDLKSKMVFIAGPRRLDIISPMERFGDLLSPKQSS
jgi:hypothetical protein